MTEVFFEKYKCGDKFVKIWEQMSSILSIYLHTCDLNLKT